MKGWIIMNNGRLKPDIWKKVKNKFFELVLPSGQKVKVCHPHIFDLVKLGVLPSGILQKVFKMSMFVENQKLDISKAEDEDLQILMTVIDKFVLYAVLEPKIVVSNPKEDEIEINDIPTEDKMYIFSRLTGSEEGLPEFFSETEQCNIDTSVSVDIRTETQ